MIGISLNVVLWFFIVTRTSAQTTEASGAGESTSTSIPAEEGLAGNSQPESSQNFTSQKGQGKSLANLVVVDLLCQQLPVQSRACLVNKAQLDSWVARETTSSPSPSSSSTPIMAPPASVTNHSSLGLTLPNIGLKEKWRSFFRTLAKVIPLIGTVKDTGFEKLKSFLQTTPIAVSDLLTSLGLSSASRLQEINNIASRLKIKIDTVVEKMETVEMSFIVSTAVSLILFMIGAALWIANNFAAWRRGREERRNLRRDRRASRMLLGLQRARYSQAQQQVVVV